MAVAQTQTLPAPFLESITKQYATGLGGAQEMFDVSERLSEVV